MERRRRADDAYVAAHPTPPDIKETFERMRRQAMPPRSGRMIRFLADADLNHATVKNCRRREPALDFLS